MSAASILRKTRQGFAAWALCSLIVCGCRAPLDVGSDVLWATNHESGTIDDWNEADGGGLLLLEATKSPVETVEISDSFAHSGRYALKLTEKGASDSNGPGVYREITSPPDLYYSAWYYVPRTYVTNSEWTIQQFRSRSDLDLNQVGLWHDLNLRTLPGGQVLLYVYSHNTSYLQAPLANPPAFVPIETWFQLESLYRPRTDATGLLKVWLDDRLVYDLEGRITAGSNDVLWGPCNIAEDVQPAPPELYVDDAAISVVRVTRAGKLFSDY
jgi:hypothetical protein